MAASWGPRGASVPPEWELSATRGQPLRVAPVSRRGGSLETMPLARSTVAGRPPSLCGTLI
eukprot:1284864-Pleurochrysis_carterae.AAC.1